MDPKTLQFRLTITCDTPELTGPRAQRYLARILRHTAARLTDGEDFGCYLNLPDSHGETVGQAALKTVEEHDGGRRHARGAR